MKPKSGSEKALEYIESHSRDKKIRKTGPCITVSRQSGAGSSIVDEKLKNILEKNQGGEFGEWAIFDKNLIERIMEDHNIPERLTNLFSSEKQSAITNMVNELLGLAPSTKAILHQTAETILQLGITGNVIIVGRAGNIVASHLTNAFHVKLVAPLENRIVRIQEYYNIGRKQAVEWIKREDLSRKEYYSKNYHRDIDNPLLYHLTINTGLLSYEEAASLIAHSVMQKFPSMFLKPEEVLT
jgi:cytidylate kinase